MSSGMTPDVQTYLFQTQLAWQELPREVRQQVSELLAIMCIEIVEELQSPSQETNDESRSHSTLAP
ncbi:MAG: hypothetical protein ACOY3P_02295 [Planctomycetota bacterium]